MSELIINSVTPLVDVEQVLLDLEAETDFFPVDAIRTIQKSPDLFVPRLIETIDRAMAYHETGEFLEGDAHVFAVLLLTEFRAQQAWPTIRRALLLPDDQPYELFGEIVFDCLDRMLAVFAPGRIEILDELLSHPDLDPCVRNEITSAFFYLVRDGHMTRDEAVERLHHLLRAAITDADPQSVTELIRELVNYAPHEALDDIRSAYDNDLVDPDQIEWSEVEESIAEGQAGFEMLLGDCQPTGIQDTVHELEAYEMSEDDPEDFFDDFDEHEDRVIDRESASKFALVMDMLRREFEGIAPLNIEELDTDEPEIEVGTIYKTERRVGRNEPCPCGSGKKFKKCCGGS